MQANFYASQNASDQHLMLINVDSVLIQTFNIFSVLAQHLATKLFNIDSIHNSSFQILATIEYRNKGL